MKVERKLNERENSVWMMKFNENHDARGSALLGSHRHRMPHARLISERMESIFVSKWFVKIQYSILTIKLFHWGLYFSWLQLHSDLRL